MSPRSADSFRRAGILFIDTAGNASIRFGEVLIDVRGRRADIESPQPERERGGNLFSTARSRIRAGGHRSDSELLDLWVASFPQGLGQKLTLGTYRGSIDEFRNVDAEDPVFMGGPALSGELAADDLLRPASLTIYVAGLDPMLPVKNRWRSGGEGNITVRRKFWTTPPHESQDYGGPLTGLRNAPAALVYADLMASDDPRVRGVAPECRGRLDRHESDR